MSEYQYYEFQAIDSPLTGKEMETLRTFSSREEMSSTRFSNVYHWGSLQGDRHEWMQRYFDAHISNGEFGSRLFCQRFPLGWIDQNAIMPYQQTAIKTLKDLDRSNEFMVNLILLRRGRVFSGGGGGWLG